MVPRNSSSRRSVSWCLVSMIDTYQVSLKKGSNWLFRVLFCFHPWTSTFIVLEVATIYIIDILLLYFIAFRQCAGRYSFQMKNLTYFVEYHQLPPTNSPSLRDTPERVSMSIRTAVVIVTVWVWQHVRLGLLSVYWRYGAIKLASKSVQHSIWYQVGAISILVGIRPAV